MVFAATSVVFFVSFALLSAHDGEESIPVAFLPFGLACVVTLFCLIVFYEDLTNRGAGRREKRRWGMAFGTLPWIAVPLYWWRHVRLVRGDPGGRISSMPR